MGQLQIRLGTSLLLGAGQSVIPIAATVQRDTAGTQIAFGLDRGPTDPPVELSLGELVDFVESQIGAHLGGDAGQVVAAALPQVGADLSPANPTRVELRVLSVQTSPAGTSLAVAVDVVGASPSDPAIGLPAEVAGWFAVRSVGLAFAVSATP